MFEEARFRTGSLDLQLARRPQHGPPMLFLHGVLRRWQDFSLLLPHFASRWQVHALDFRGHGGSRPGEAYRVADYAGDVAAFLREKLEEPAVIYGHSLGAMVACAAAAAVPERVLGVVLEDPPFETLGREIRGTSFYAQFLGMRAARERHPEDVDALARELAEVRIPTAAGTIRLGDVRDGTQLRWSASCLVKLDPAVFDPLLSGEWLEGLDVEAVLRGVRCPALLLVADSGVGGMLPPALADRVASLLPRGIRVDLPGTGHNAHWEDPQGILKRVTGFCESL